MAESVCLLRSFSQPAEIYSPDETNEVVPRRVLTESVSFGRFASESLQWEKWSAFTQNRYLEEVERFTRPGSVAQKKAFFEAHFKNRAAGRATQTEIERASDEILCVEDNRVDSQVALEVNTGMAMNEVRHGQASNVEVDSVVPSIPLVDKTTDNLIISPVENYGMAMDEVSIAEVESAVPSIGELTVARVESFNSMAVVPQGEALTEENSTSLCKERRPSSSGSKTCSTRSKLESSFAIGLDLPLKETRKEPPSRTKRSISVSNQKRLPPERFRISNNCATSGNTEKNIAEMPQEGSRSCNSAKGAGKADKKKGSGPNSVHMSVTFASSPRQTTKTALKNLARNSTTQETTSSQARNSVFPNGNEPTEASRSRKRPLSRTATEGFKAAKCSASASAVRLPEFPSFNTRLSEDKRKNITVGSRISCRTPNKVQRQTSVGSENLSSHSKTRAKSITVSCHFNFRSDERAEKRKEFFKKLEEKNTHLASEEHKNPHVGGSKVPPVSLTSPRFCRNQNSGPEKLKTSHQSFGKVSSIKTIINTRNAEHKHSKIHLSQTKKKTQENMSPNIQRI